MGELPFSFQGSASFQETIKNPVGTLGFGTRMMVEKNGETTCRVTLQVKPQAGRKSAKTGLSTGKQLDPDQGPTSESRQIRLSFADPLILPSPNSHRLLLGGSLQKKQPLETVNIMTPDLRGANWAVRFLIPFIQLADQNPTPKLTTC